MSNMSYEEPRMEMPQPHLMPDGMQYRDEKHRSRDDTEDFDNAMDEHGPVIQDTLQNRDSLIRGIINGTSQPSTSNRKRNSRRGVSHGTSASLSSTNTVNPRAPASQSSVTSSHNGHARHASASAVNGATNGTPTADEISKLISRLATERQKTANLQDSLSRANADTQFHAKRLEDAEARMGEQRKREAENTKRRKAMEIEVSKMREQLRFVKVQYDGAVAEIKKAQDVINSLEEERGRAVMEANREREKVRILEEERKLKEAREAGYEEGRKLGMEEGVKRGAAEGKRYGVKDGREAERERQKQAMRELVEDDDVYEPRPPREQQHQREFTEPREIYHRVGDETPGLSRSRSLNVNPTIAPVVTVDPQTHTANVLGLPLLETGNPSAAGYPSTAPANLSRHPSAPTGSRQQHQTHSGHGPPNYSAVFPRDNPNVNILSGFGEEPVRALGMTAPELSMEASLGKRDNRISAPPRINTSSVERDRDRSDPSQQRSWGGGIIGNGQGYRAPIRQRSGSGGTNGTTGTGINGIPRTNGRGSVTPPSASTQDRSTPLDQYGILGDGGSYGGGLMSQVAEMTPIMEAGSEPGPTPTQAYFHDAAMGVRPPQEEIDRRDRERRAQEQRETEERVRYEQERLRQQQQHQQQQNRRWEPPPQPPQESRYVPPQRRTPQPSPTNPTGPGGANEWRRKSPQPSSTSNSSTLVNNSTRGPQRKPVPNLGAAPVNGRPRGNSINAPRGGHGRAASADMYDGTPAAAIRPGAGASGGHSLPPIEIFPGTPPDQANARSAKMAQAGGNLMGSPAFVTRDIGYAADPGAVGGRGAGGSQLNGGGGHGHGHGGGHGNGHGHGHGGRGDYGPHGTPLASPQPIRSPLLTQGELRNEYVENDPTGGQYRPNSRQQHGSAKHASSSTASHRRGAVSMGGLGDHGHHQQPPPSPSRFTTELHNPSHQHRPPPPSSPSQFHNPPLAQPTPRHAANALDMSPEEIMIHPSGMTPVPAGRFDAGGQYAGAPPSTTAAKGKGKAKPSAQVKQMRRQGYVDYDDEVPEDLTMGYSVRDQDPPMTTRSRVQSMYGISDHNGPKRTPHYESAPLPKKTPAYEDAPLPPPKSARMMPGGLPQHQPGGYTLGLEGRSLLGHGEPMPSPAKSQTSSQARRIMEEDLDAPISPYDREDHDQNRFSTIDILDEKAEQWEPRSGTFHERKLPRSYAQDEVEIVPPPNASPQNRPIHRQDASFLGTSNHPPPPAASPRIGARGPANAYVDTRHFDDSSMGPIHSSEASSFMVDRSGNPIRTPMRQSMPITASARSSTSAMPLPPVQPNDIPWATGKTTTSQLPRPDTMYESAPPSAVPNTSTTWGYVRDSGQSLAPLGPISNGGLAFGVGGGMSNQAAMYNLANTSPVSTGRAQPMPLPTFHQNQMPPPGSTRSNIMQIPGTARSGVTGLPPPGSTRFNIMDVAPPGTGRSMAHPLPSQSQIMLAGMLSPQGPGPEMDEDPIIPSGGPAGGGAKKKKGGKKKK